jgi:alpha-amylase
MSPLHLALLIHAHQPLGNFESIQEEVYRLAYLPFVEAVEQHPGIRIAFHYSGILLEWLEKRHPDYIEKLRGLVERGQAEMLGGGYYEPVLSAILERDRRAQLERMSEYVERRFGQRPRGVWLTERVWDPTLPETLARAGVKYTLTDDYHFLSVGLQKEQLHGYYLTSWQGSSVKVIPGLKSLRYLLPFRMENECIAYLREIAGKQGEKSGEQPGETLAAMGDDLEKFGAWPETHQHVYTDGWLRRFFEAVEQSSDWLRMTLAGDYVEANRPLGLIYLPTASYQEMMGWALPFGAGEKYEELLRRVEQMPDGEKLAPFVHGGVWHNFFHKYEEANHLHKRMLDLSKRYGAAGKSRARRRKLYRPGYEELLRAQCNDAYWHGVFGGLYAPHLRTSVYQSLIRAEQAVEKLEPAPRKARRFDFNVDGAEEIFLSNEALAVVIAAGDGGAVAEIDYRPRSYNAINSLRRRPESYHAKLRESQQWEAGGAVSIHDRVIAKEANLDRYLLYDRHSRRSFRSLLFAAGRTMEDYRLGRLEESQQLAGGAYEVIRAGRSRCELAARDAHCLCDVRNDISIAGASVEADWRVTHRGLAELEAGLELVLNLLAPEAHDRYFVLPGANEKRPPLNWSGEVKGDCLALVDEWLNLRIDVKVRPATAWWILPIFTVSQSEQGFEKVYQGSCLLPHWPLEDGELRATVRLDFGTVR